MKKLYTSEENIQILISLLKKHNIKHIVVSPGATNISFVASIQSDDFFKLYSCVDERSAAYIACGIAEEIKEPVVITCTGATASRNYLPGLTEAYYRHLPIIAITATQHLGRIGQNIPQVIDRSIQQKDVVKKTVQLLSVSTAEDRWSCNLKVNDALLECRRNGGGTVHINLVTTYSNELNCTELPNERLIERIEYNNDFPKINVKQVAIAIGSHLEMSKELTSEIEEFCEKYNGVVLCDHTSNYNGKYKVLPNLICEQFGSSDLKNVELLIDFGDVSGAYMSLFPKEVWRISDDGEIRDTFKKLRYVFQLNELDFFKKYNSDKKEKVDTSYFKLWKNTRNNLAQKLSKVELPFSNLWITSQVINKIEEGSIVHLSILNTLRSWNYYDCGKRLRCYSNTGGFGIDGIMSSAVGASIVANKNVYCFIGDLAFFYDLNSIGNRELGNNLRIMMINNGCGTEFHNYNHRAVAVEKANDLSPMYIAADGHFGNKSKNLVKHYAEDLGFEYLSASNKDEFLGSIDKFFDSNTEKPIVFEVFTDSEEESEALKKINNLEVNTKAIIKKVIGTDRINKIKKVLGK